MRAESLCLELGVQLRRLLLPEMTRRPDVASQFLGLVLRELPAERLG